MRKTTKEILQGAIEEADANIEKFKKTRDETEKRLGEINAAIEELEMLAADLRHDLGEAAKETA